VSISPQSHRAEAYTSSSTNNCNASLPKKGCGHAVAYYTVHRSQRRQLLHSCGISDGPTDSANNCNVSLLREGCARVVVYCTICRFRHKRLLRFCGILDGPTNSVRCLAHRFLYRQLQHSCANFDMSWLNYAQALICGTRFSKKLVCSSFWWASKCYRRAAKATKALPCCAMNARIHSYMLSGIVENICWVYYW
jgi:hypothetical protein